MRTVFFSPWSSQSSIIIHYHPLSSILTIITIIINYKSLLTCHIHLRIPKIHTVRVSRNTHCCRFRSAVHHHYYYSPSPPPNKYHLHCRFVVPLLRQLPPPPTLQQVLQKGMRITTTVEQEQNFETS